MVLPQLNELKVSRQRSMEYISALPHSSDVLSVSDQVYIQSIDLSLCIIFNKGAMPKQEKTTMTIFILTI